ncbi:hypothetical protein ACFL21_02125 [Patescibacteria group bacterium]
MNLNDSDKKKINFLFFAIVKFLMIAKVTPIHLMDQSTQEEIPLRSLVIFVVLFALPTTVVAQEVPDEPYTDAVAAYMAAKTAVDTAKEDSETPLQGLSFLGQLMGYSGNFSEEGTHLNFGVGLTYLWAGGQEPSHFGIGAEAVFGFGWFYPSLDPEWYHMPMQMMLSAEASLLIQFFEWGPRSRPSSLDLKIGYMFEEVIDEFLAFTETGNVALGIGLKAHSFQYTLRQIFYRFLWVEVGVMHTFDIDPKLYEVKSNLDANTASFTARIGVIIDFELAP